MSVSWIMALALPVAGATGWLSARFFLDFRSSLAFPSACRGARPPPVPGYLVTEGRYRLDVAGHGVAYDISLSIDHLDFSPAAWRTR